jgi:hypothetical protein
MLTSVSYEMPGEAFRDAQSLETHLARYPHLRGQSLEGWRFELAFVAPTSGVHFVRFAPR